MRYVVLEKPIGQTPLEAIQNWKAQNPTYAAIPASYAGRLDPMASGKLLVLLGDECKRQSAYTQLDKEYEVEILLDLGSDTGDVLGVVSPGESESHPTNGQIHEAVRTEIGTREHRYPVFSSKTVNGKPLFLYALEGSLETITVPTHWETIYHISLLDSYSIAKDELQERIASLLSLTPTSDEPSKALGADFRIKKVRDSWEKAFASMPQRSFTILRVRVTCGSGSYMRSLAGRIGESLTTKALALSIHRTKIGRVWNVFGIIFWLRNY